MLPIWFLYIQGIAVVLIPPFGAWIAWQQVRIGRVKLKHDLFDRRLAVYSATRDFLFIIASNKTPTSAEAMEFNRGTVAGDFLFDDELADHLREIRMRTLKMRVGQASAERKPDGDEKEAVRAKARSHYLWLVDQLNSLSEKFKPFLRLDDLR
jgi:hypothetical protein